jgi:alpha-L-fucosidase
MSRGCSFSRIQISIMILLCLLNATALPENFADVKPSPQQIAWQDLEFGVIIHFSTNTFLDREWGDGTADPKLFNPTDFDAEQWVRAIQAAGAKYVVLVAKHHDGFCLWPTQQSDYSVKASPWQNGKGDVVLQVSEAARKYGLKFGVYLSPWDRHDPRYANSAEYDKYYTAELDELAQSYGELVEFWLDGAGSAGHIYNFPRFIEELRTYQPNTLVFADTGLFEYGDIRWAGNEDGTIPYENWNTIDRHGYLRWRPVEADTPLRKGHWFWHTNSEDTLKPVDELVSMYEQSVGHGGQLMLGIAPDRRGLLPETDVKRLADFGAAVHSRYGNEQNLVAKHHVHTEKAIEAALDGNPDTFWSAPTNSHAAIIEADFVRPVSFDHALTMEWLNDGQHVQRYRIEVWNGTGWTVVAEGQAIGHKKIDSFPRVTGTRARLNILASSSEVHIREFQIFDVRGMRQSAGK